MVAHKELEEAWNKWKVDPGFKAELAELRRDFIGGPTPLYHAKRLTKICGGAQIWMKREELDDRAQRTRAFLRLHAEKGAIA